MNDDASLLHRYAVEGSQEAFAELVRRHLSLVYHAALRQTSGDLHRAEEIAQLVFTDLARKAAALSRRPLLVAWLHTSTRYAASQLRRTESRRLAREHAAFTMNADESSAATAPSAWPASDSAAADWDRLRPLIDDALQSLSDRDRAAVLLRFFENRSYGELAAAFDVTEDAARVRVNRALEKLRSSLARLGVASTASALSLALAQPALASTPAGLAASITSASLTAASTAAAAATLAAPASLASAFFEIAALTVGAVTAISLGVAISPSGSADLPTPSSPLLAPPSLTPTDSVPSDLIYRPSSILPTALPSTSSAAASGSTPAPKPAPTLKIPPRLIPADATDALALYLALPSLPSEADPTAFNTRAAQLRALLTLLPSESFPRLLDALAAREGGAEHRLRSLAFEVWTEREAAVAARWAESFAPTRALDPGTRLAYLRQAAVAWAARDFDTAYAWSNAHADPALVGDLARALILELASTDGPRALALARARDGDFFPRNESRLVLNWSRQDPAAALRTLGSTALSEQRFDYAYQSALGVWFRQNPSAALDWLFAQPPPANSLEEFKFQTLLTSGEVLNIPDPGLVATALLGRPQQSKYLGILLRNWQTRAPAAALVWLDALPDAALRTELLEFGAEQTSIQTRDPARYLPLILRLPPGENRDAKLTKLLTALAATSPDAALAWLRAHDTPEFAGVAARMNGKLIGDLAATDPSAALTRWQALPEGSAKSLAAAGLAQNWAKADPAAAARWYAALLPATPKDQLVGLSIMNVMMRANPGSGTEVRVGGATEEELAQNRAFAATTRAWAQKDPLAALQWAETLPDPAHRQLAITVIGTTDSRPPAQEADLLAQLRDPALRFESLSTLLHHWLRKDPPAARAWLDTHDALTPEQTAKLLQQIDADTQRASSLPAPR